MEILKQKNIIIKINTTEKITNQQLFTKKIKHEGYWINSTQHRENDKPCSIYYYENGSIYSEQYYINGYPYRDDDKPAVICYYPSESGNDVNLNIKSELYFTKGSLHRDNDKPSFIEYDVIGNIIREKFFINGKCKRLNLDYPTVIEYKNSGNDIVNIFTDEYGKELKREELFGAWNK